MANSVAKRLNICRYFYFSWSFRSSSNPGAPVGCNPIRFSIHVGVARSSRWFRLTVMLLLVMVRGENEVTARARQNTPERLYRERHPKQKPTPHELWSLYVSSSLLLATDQPAQILPISTRGCRHSGTSTFGSRAAIVLLDLEGNSVVARGGKLGKRVEPNTVTIFSRFGTRRVTQGFGSYYLTIYSTRSLAYTS